MIMKKKLSVFIAAAITVGLPSAIRASAAELTGFYADAYGIVADFGSAVKSSEIGGCSLTCDGARIEVIPDIDGSRVTLAPVEKLEADKKYTLNIAGQTKSFIIKTVFFEDFDDRDGRVEVAAEEENGYGRYKIIPGDGEAFYTDGEIALANALFSVTDIYDSVDTKNATFTADVKGYGKRFNATTSPNAGLVQILMGIRGQNPDSGKDGYALRMTNAKGYVGTVDDQGKFTAVSNGSYTEDGEKYGFSVVTNSDISLDGEYTYDAMSDEKEIAVRAYGSTISAFADSYPITEISDSSYTDGYFNLSADLRTLAVIDNVRITAFMEETRPTALEGDFDSLKLCFDKALDGAEDFSKIEVYENNTLVNADISLDSSDSKQVIILPEDYKAGVEYTIRVMRGFGAKSACTCEDYSFTASLEKQEIKVIGADVDVDNYITVTFDSKILSVVDNDRVSVYKNGEPVNAEKSIVDDTLTVKPEDYEKDAVYRIEIEQGFFNGSFYIFEGFSYEQKLTKRNIGIEKITSSSLAFVVTFTEDIPTDIASKVKVYKNDAEMTVKGSNVSGKILTLNIDAGIDQSAEYEMYIEAGAETAGAYMREPYLCKIKNGTIIEAEDIVLSSVMYKVDPDEGSITGSFKIKNFSGEDKSICVAVAAYGEKDFMQTAQVLDISEVKTAQIIDAAFSLDKVSDIKQIGIFVWDSPKNLKLLQYFAAGTDGGG